MPRNSARETVPTPDPPAPSSFPSHWGRQPAPPAQTGFQKLFHQVAVRTLRMMPRSVVRLAASPYIAGETQAEAWAVSDRLWNEKKLRSTVDVLGEEIQSESDIEAYFTEFESLVQNLADRPYANLSIKLSALGQREDENACFERARLLVRHAREQNTFVRFDMEDATTVDSTLRIYRRVRQELDNCGIVLQSRLFRTRQDVEDLKPLAPNVRLCIGIYPESPDIAMTDKVHMKKHLLELLEVLWRNGQHVGVATHEEWVIREAIALADRLNKPRQEIEVQMLLGVPRDTLQRELIGHGIPVRLYVPYGKRWYAYSMRRLDHNPDVLRMVAGNVFSGFFRRR
jgi:proline dehydrogenase